MGILGLPVISGHRGYKGKYPENTILGFTKCFETGATDFETDLYLTKDNVLVVSHDVNTKRTYVTPDGEEADYDIPSSSYEEDLKDLRNKATGDKFLTFKHLLNFIIENDQFPNRRVMLDIKTYNKPKIMKNVFEEMLSVKDDPNYWLPKFQLGIWDLGFAKYMNQDEYFQKLYQKYTIEKPVQLIHISVSTAKSTEFIGYNHYLKRTYGKERHLFQFTGVSLLYLLTWHEDFLKYFVPMIKVENLDLYTWTVNNTYQYDYFVKVCKAAGIKDYGVLSDDPGLMVEHKKKVSSVSSTVRLELKQKLAHFGFSLFTYFLPNNKLDYKSQIDPEQGVTRPVNGAVVLLFRICQNWLKIF